jgi:putative transposase
MSHNYYSELHLHIVWHTKPSQPLLTPDVERFTHRYLRGGLINTPGVYVHEVGGTETHVHLAVTVPPTVLISELIGQLKGASSHEVNQQLGVRRKLLEWQSGYGVVSFGTNNLEWVANYIHHQKEHHAKGTAVERLERIVAEEVQAQAEQREAP